MHYQRIVPFFQLTTSASLIVALSVVLTRGLLALIPIEGQPLLINAYPDGRILAFTLGLTFVTAIASACVSVAIPSDT